MKHAATEKQRRYIETFKANMLSGIRYYEELAPVLHQEATTKLQRFKEDLARHAADVGAMLLPEHVLA